MSLNTSFADNHTDYEQEESLDYDAGSDLEADYAEEEPVPQPKAVKRQAKKKEVSKRAAKKTNNKRDKTRK